MIRKLITALLFSVLTLSAMAQVDNGQRIAIMPVVSDDLQLPAEAKKALNQKLLQMTTQNGFGATSGTFVLTANVNTTNKIVSTTIPVQIVIDLEVSVYVVNLTENFIAAETSFNVQGMDANDTRAQVKAINSLNAKSPAVRKFMTTARENIIDYYTGRVTTIIAKAQSCADRGEYEDAIEILAGVPECLEEYPMVAAKMTAIYTQMVDKEAASAIQLANSKIALKDYPAALDALMTIDPTSSRFGEASAMVESIRKSIEARDKAAQQAKEAKEQQELEARLKEMESKRELALKLHDDEVMLQKTQIEASKGRSERVVKSDRSSKRLQKRLSEWLFGNL